MEFGKTDRFQDIDYSFPEEPERNFKNWGPSNLKVYVGAPVFNHSELIKKIDRSAALKNSLETYAKFFSCIELNSSFYSIPSFDQTKKWKSMVPGHFKFCCKFPKVVSHHGTGFSKLNTKISEFLSAVNLFGDQNGSTFIQFPEHFDLNYLPELKSFIKRLPSKIPVSVELRDKEFKNEDIGCPKVILDVAGRRELFDLSLYSDWVLVRFVGNSLHETDFQRLDNWVEQLKKWNERGVSKVYFILHQPNEANCYDLALYLKEKLGKLVIGCEEIQAPQMDLI